MLTSCFENILKNKFNLIAYKLYIGLNPSTHYWAGRVNIYFALS
jgi:hypothetical protein